MTETLLIYAETGELRMVVHDAVNHDDPAWNPKGCVTVKLLRSEYDKCSDYVEIMLASKPLIADAKISDAVQVKIDEATTQKVALDAILAAPVDVPPETETTEPK